MFVVRGVDELHSDADAIAAAPDASFENGGNAERLANFARIMRSVAIRHHRKT